METSVNGIFAAGDIRSGSIKCIAVAQGEGVAAIEHIRTHLRSLE
jgi:thioredoxin reductase (NADPH)